MIVTANQDMMTNITNLLLLHKSSSFIEDVVNPKQRVNALCSINFHACHI